MKTLRKRHLAIVGPDGALSYPDLSDLPPAALASYLALSALETSPPQAPTPGGEQLPELREAA